MFSLRPRYSTWCLTLRVKGSESPGGVFPSPGSGWVLLGKAERADGRLAGSGFMLGAVWGVTLVPVPGVSLAVSSVCVGRALLVLWSVPGLILGDVSSGLGLRALCSFLHCPALGSSLHLGHPALGSSLHLGHICTLVIPPSGHLALRSSRTQLIPALRSSLHLGHPCIQIIPALG